MFWIPNLRQIFIASMLPKAAGNMISNSEQSFPGSGSFWQSIEVVQVPSLIGRKESFCSLNKHYDPEIAGLLGSAPDSSICLLHTAPWDSDGYPVPVILIHGAGINGNSWVVDFKNEGEGLARFLRKKGFRVFAVTFSHTHGENMIQAAQIARVVDIVCERTGCKKVDLVCHSKGGIVCRTWLQGMTDVPFRGNVRRLILSGVPNLGTDQVFRHPLLSIISHSLGVSNVVAYDYMWPMGVITNTTLESIYGDGSFKGQTQLLYEWADSVPLNLLEPEVQTTYYGGWSLFGHSRGIKQAIADGGFYLQKLNKLKFPQQVEVAIMAGSKHYFGQVAGETGAPSDGMVFIQSAIYDDSFVKSGCRLLSIDILDVNHLEMIYHNQAAEWVFQQLTAD